MNRFIYWFSEGYEPYKIKAKGWFKKEYTLTELFELTELALGLFPDYKFKLVFLEDSQAVQDVYFDRYQVISSKHSFMSKSDLTAWFSLEDLTPRVFVHEIAHLILELNQNKKISSSLHETIAQWVEKEVFRL